MRVRKNEDGERGAVLVLVSIAIVTLLLITALAIDVGYWYVHKNHLRQVAEAASLAGTAYMPDTDSAYPAAKAVMKQNGIEYYDGACTSSNQYITTFLPVYGGYGLEVSITDCKTSTFFSSIALGSTVSTTGKASAVIGVPVPMGSPANHIGTGPLFDGDDADNFFSSIDGFCVPKENGDQFATGWDFNQMHSSVPGMTVPHVSGGSIFNSCGPGADGGHGQDPDASWIVKNNDHDLDTATNLPRKDGDSFYKYVITVPEAGLNDTYDLLAYDPALAGCDEHVMAFTPYSYWGPGWISPGARLTCKAPSATVCHGKYNPGSGNFDEYNRLTCVPPSGQCRGQYSTSGFCYDPRFFDENGGCRTRSDMHYNQWPLAPGNANPAGGCTYTADNNSSNGAIQPDMDLTTYDGIDIPFNPVTTSFQLHSKGSSYQPVGPTVVCKSTYKSGFYPGTDNPNTFLAGSVNTAVKLKAPGLATPASPVPNWSDNTTWAKICNFSFGPSTEPGSYVLQVSTKFKEPNSFGGNSYGLTLQPSGKPKLISCDADKNKHCPSIAALDHMGAIYRLPNATKPASFHLARLDKSNRGRQVTLSVWDPAEGMQYLEIGTPNSSGTAFGAELDPLKWQLAMRIGDNGCKSGPGSHQDPDIWPLPGTFDFPLDVSGPKASSTECDAPGLAGPVTGLYNRNLVQFKFRVPADYDPGSYVAGGDEQVGGWLWVRYTPVIGGTTTDRTTWSLNVSGTPIRLTS